MCEFKPGDELVYVGPQSGLDRGCLERGSLHVCRSLHPHPFSGAIGVKVDARSEPVLWTSFRKVQRRDLSAWLKTATKFEEPKRKKADA